MIVLYTILWAVKGSIGKRYQLTILINLTSDIYLINNGLT